MSEKIEIYTDAKPANVSRNLARLRQEAGWSRGDLAAAAALKIGMVEKFEVVYEPPTNHPYLLELARVLSDKLGRDVRSELLKGGRQVEFAGRQLARVYTRAPHLAPPGFFKSGIHAGGAPRKATTKGSTKLSSEQYQAVIDFLNTDPRVATLAKQFGLALPNAKTSANGAPLGQTQRAIRERAYRLQATLRRQGVDLRQIMRDQHNPASKPVYAPAETNGYKRNGDLRSLVYNCVTTFNQRRMTGEKTMVMPMDVFEHVLADYLKHSGISSNVLVGPDFAKLVPRG